MEFKNLKAIQKFIPQKPVRKVKYWTDARCRQLAQNFYMLEEESLRKMFDGYSLVTIKKQAYKLQKAGWTFAKKIS